MKEFMLKTRENYYKAQKNFMFSLYKTNKIVKQKWMILPLDPYYKATYRDSKELFKKGKIAIASIVQANNMIYRDGKVNCPAVVVYSEDTYYDENPRELEKIAEYLFNIKGEKVEDKDIQFIADNLAEEKTPIFNYELEGKYTNNRKVFLTYILVHREHLNNKALNLKFIPIIVNREITEATAIVPINYWAKIS